MEIEQNYHHLFFKYYCYWDSQKKGHTTHSLTRAQPFAFVRTFCLFYIACSFNVLLLIFSACVVAGKQKKGWFEKGQI